MFKQFGPKNNTHESKALLDISDTVSADNFNDNNNSISSFIRYSISSLSVNSQFLETKRGSGPVSNLNQDEDDVEEEYTVLSISTGDEDSEDYQFVNSQSLLSSQQTSRSNSSNRLLLDDATKGTIHNQYNNHRSVVMAQLSIEPRPHYIYTKTDFHLIFKYILEKKLDFNANKKSAKDNEKFTDIPSVFGKHRDLVWKLSLEQIV